MEVQILFGLRAEVIRSTTFIFLDSIAANLFEASSLPFMVPSLLIVPLASIFIHVLHLLCTV